MNSGLGVELISQEPPDIAVAIGKALFRIREWRDELIKITYVTFLWYFN